MLADTPPAILSDQLRSDEKLLWFGKPQPFRLAIRRPMPIVFGIVWTVFVVFMYNFAQTNFFNRRPTAFDAPNSFSSIQPLFTLILLVFIGVGIWMILTPVRNYVKALNTYYGVTDQRAIVISKLFSTTIISYGKRDLRSIRREVHADGTGDVIFGYDQHTYTDYNYQQTPGNPTSGGINININDGNVNVSTGPVTRTVTTAIGFFAILDHQEVEMLMVKTLLQKEEA